MTKEQLKEIAKKYKFDLNEEQAEVLAKDFSKFLRNLEKMQTINVSNVHETDYCVDTSCNTLRKDEPIIVEHPEEFTKNAKNKLEKYITIK